MFVLPTFKSILTPKLPTTAVSTNTFGQNWAARVVTNGGAAVGSGSISAVDQFWAGMISNSLDTSMLAVNVFCSESLTACITPILVNSGSDPWTNTRFVGVGTDLTANGLQGNGATWNTTGKYLTTGVNAVNLGTGSAGMSMYIYTGNSAYGNDAGLWVASGNGAFSAYVPLTATTGYWDCWNTAGGRKSATFGITGGFFVYNRDSNTTSQVYRANSYTGWGTYINGTGESAIGYPPAGTNIMVFNFGGLSTGNPASTKTFSFFAVHRGLTSAQGSNMYNLVQAMRVKMGGGYR